jgi:hypothetical protein
VIQAISSNTIANGTAVRNRLIFQIPEDLSRDVIIGSDTDKNKDYGSDHNGGTEKTNSGDNQILIDFFNRSRRDVWN